MPWISTAVKRLFASFAIAAGIGTAAMQAADCGVLLGNSSITLPLYTGTLPGSADMSLGGNSSYLYVLTQWGMVRGSLADPANPGSFTQIVIGKEGGSNNGGIIPILCDCHQGGNTMDVAEAPDGSSRVISDWQPFKQGGGDSGLGAQLATTLGSGVIAFGNQIDTPSDVPLGSRVSAVYLPSSGKYFGYFPTSGNNVQKADMTSPNGSPDPGEALPTVNAIGWASTPTSGVRLAEAHVVTGSYNKHVLVGATPGTPGTLHWAEIDENNGNLTEVANVPMVNFAIQMDVGVINGEIFVVAAEGSFGMNVYKFTPPSTLQYVTGMAGTYFRAFLRGPQPFPALLTNTKTSSTTSYVDIFDTKWITEGGSPIRAAHLFHEGNTNPQFKGKGFEALVQQTGATVTAYVYREVQNYEGGNPRFKIYTDKIDVSCIAADPNAPPIPFAVMTNLSAQARGDGTNYHGDKWQIQDASVSYAPILERDWDFHYIGPFVAEKITNPGSDTYNPAYWPCDLLSGGNLDTGTGCFQSLGTIVTNYQLALQTKNVNSTPGNLQTYISPATPVLQPQIVIVGYNGNVLQVLTGGTADARGSQGNTAESTFAWTFTPGGAASGLNPTVPSGATAFSVAATYKGGYSTSKSGTVVQVDLVPNFSLAPNPVLKGSNLTLKNLMQIGAAATVTSVDYAITPGGGSGTLPSAFNAVNGQATVTAPGTAGSYNIALTWHYTVAGVPKTAGFSLPFSATDFNPNPVLSIYKDAGHTMLVPPTGSPLTFYLQTGVTYYLFDDETVPGGNHPGASFWKSSDQLHSISQGDTQLPGSPTAGYGPATFSSTSACNSGCYFKVEVPQSGGVVNASRYVVQGGTPPPTPTPTPPPGASLSLAVPSPVNPNVGQTVTFTATANGFAPASYSWDFGDSGPPSGGGAGGGDCVPQPGCQAVTSPQAASVAGPNPNTHVYTATGTYIVTCTATGGGVTRSASTTVIVKTGGPPSPFYTVSGATLSQSSGRYEAPMNQVVTFTATEANALSWDWNFGDGTSATGRTVQHSFTELGGPNATLTVTGDGTNTIGTSSSVIALTIVDPGVLYLNDRRFEVRTSWVSNGQGTSGVGTAVQLTPDTGYFWFFYPANLEVVVKVLDACSVDGYFWVFGGGLTNLGVQMTVLDTFTGVSKVYGNTEGQAFQPIQDTRFEACPAATNGSVSTRAAAAPGVTLSAPTPATPVTGDAVSFTATASGFADDSAVTYKWNFGDCPPVVQSCSAMPGSATESHQYQGAGTFTVTVTASQGSQSAIAIGSVTVTEASPTIPHPSGAYTLVGATAGPGNVWKAPVNQAITFNALETHAQSYTWDFGDGTEAQTGATVTHTFTLGGSPQVILTVVGDGTNTDGTTVSTIRFAITDPYTLRLDNGRFAIQASWTSAAQGTSGFGTATALTTDTGYFWFFTSSNTEVVIKALDACSVDGHFWIFGSGLTNLGVVLTVTDTQSGTTMQYTNTDGSPFQPIQDFVSFSACGGS